MYVKSSPPQQEATTETWTADFLVLGQSLYHRATLPPIEDILKFIFTSFNTVAKYFELLFLLYRQLLKHLSHSFCSRLAFEDFSI